MRSFALRVHRGVGPGWLTCSFGAGAGRAWFDVASSATRAHELAECSNRGKCDKASGQCAVRLPWRTPSPFASAFDCLVTAAVLLCSATLGTLALRASEVCISFGCAGQRGFGFACCLLLAARCFLHGCARACVCVPAQLLAPTTAAVTATVKH